MKKRVRIFLALMIAIMLCLILTSCRKQKSEDPLRILLDVNNKTEYGFTSVIFEQLLEEVATQSGPAKVEVEYLPQTGIDRENAITHLRTEIISGKGPDLFIISSGYWSDGERPNDGPLFPFPEKSMYNGLFMPLDKYIENAKFAMWKDFNSTVMEVGKTDKGQVLVPLSFTFPITCFRRSDVSYAHSSEQTWDDMLSDQEGIMKASAALEMGNSVSMIKALDNPNFDAIFGKTADYQAEELLFSEEVFFEYSNKQIELYQEDDLASLTSLPDYFHDYARPYFYSGGETGSHVHPYIEKGEDLAVIPQYNKDGGVTATVFHYACINANSKRSEDAFFVLDYILSRSNIYLVDNDSNIVKSQSTRRQEFYSLFTGSNGLHIDQGIEWTSVYEGAISDSNRSAIDAATRDITAVNIHGKLNKMMANMMEECKMIVQGRHEGTTDELIKETYRIMLMELQES